MKAARLSRDLRGLLASVGISAASLLACGDAEPDEASEMEPEEAGSPADEGAPTEPAPDVAEFAAAFAVMQDRCAECHKTGTGHSFIVSSTAELTVRSAVAAKDKIAMRISAETVSLGRMPPDEPLSADDLATIQAWLQGL